MKNMVISCYFTDEDVQKSRIFTMIISSNSWKCNACVICNRAHRLVGGKWWVTHDWPFWWWDILVHCDTDSYDDSSFLEQPNKGSHRSTLGLRGPDKMKTVVEFNRPKRRSSPSKPRDSFGSLASVRRMMPCPVLMEIVHDYTISMGAPTVLTEVHLGILRTKIQIFRIKCGWKSDPFLMIFIREERVIPPWWILHCLLGDDGQQRVTDAPVLSGTRNWRLDVRPTTTTAPCRQFSH